MLTRFGLIALGGVIATALGCAGSPDSVAVDAGPVVDEQLVGTWSGTEAGDATTSWTFVISPSDMVVSTDTVTAYEASYTVVTNTSPRQFTGLITDSVFVDHVGKTANAIYEIAGDQMTFAGNEPGDPSRPSDFTADADTRVFELIRQ